MKNLWSGTALFWFLLVATLGVLLRSHAAFGLEITYSNVLHAHSHAAFLGWVFTALAGLIIQAFLPTEADANKHKIQYLFILLANTGMFISFLVSGYSIPSILFSTLHMGISVWFATGVYRSIKASRLSQPFSLADKLITAAIFFLVIASAGPLLVPVLGNLPSGTALQKNAVHYYLHFQINGWFTCSVIALILKHFEHKGISFSSKAGNRFLLLLTSSILITVVSSFTFSDRTVLITILESTGSILQLAALLAGAGMIYSLRSKIRKTLSNIQLLMLGTSSFAFAAKGLIMLAVSFIPALAQHAYTNRFLVIAFLHLVLIGVISITIWALLDIHHMIKISPGIFLTFLSSFTVTEALIALRGTAYSTVLISSNTSDMLLIIFSFIMLTCIATLFIQKIRTHSIQINNHPILNMTKYETRTNH